MKEQMDGLRALVLNSDMNTEQAAEARRLILAAEEWRDGLIDNIRRVGVQMTQSSDPQMRANGKAIVEGIR